MHGGGAATPPHAPHGRDKKANHWEEDMDTDTGEEPVCRFCFESGDSEHGPLVSPCKCAGSLRFVHVKCLHRWQSQVMLSAASREARGRRSRFWGGRLLKAKGFGVEWAFEC